MRDITSGGTPSNENLGDEEAQRTHARKTAACGTIPSIQRLHTIFPLLEFNRSKPLLIQHAVFHSKLAYFCTVYSTAQ